MIPGSRMQLWTFLADRTYQRDIKPVPTLSCGGVFRYRSGERLHGMQEVSGSIPLFSTKKALYFVGSMVLFFLHRHSKRRWPPTIGKATAIASQEISATFKQHICDMQFNVAAVALKS